jgi:CRISPR system Cascade subunit CasE
MNLPKLPNMTRLGRYRMFIHRIELTKRFSPKQIHGILGQSDARPALRHLWRFDALAGKQYLLIVSAADRIDGGELGPAESKPYDGFLNKLEKGQVWRFRLAANATICRNGKRLPLTVGGQPDWLEKRAEPNGFELQDIQVRKNDNIQFRKRQSDRNIVTIQVTEFEGILTVTDPEKLRSALKTGIGHAKAYGCGLMTLARL